MAGRLGCIIGGEGEIGVSSSRVHLEEKRRWSVARGRGRGREEF